jgi:hypothetical protein
MRRLPLALVRLLALRPEPHADPQPIAGWLYDEHGGEHFFAGWLGLLTLLEQARLKAASDAGDSTRGVNR